MLGWIVKPQELDGPVSLAVPSAGAGLILEEPARVGQEPESPTATLVGPTGAFVRLLNGRLKAPYDADARLEGSIGLDELRKALPGF